jgi:hypothetical protein
MLFEAERDLSRFTASYPPRPQSVRWRGAGAGEAGKQVGRIGVGQEVKAAFRSRPSAFKVANTPMPPSLPHYSPLALLD